MDKLDRFQLLHRTFTAHHRPVPMSTLVKRLECTPKTIKRSIEQMRDFLDAPIEYCSESKGWYYREKPGELFELPGLWLTAEELQSLVSLLHIIEGLGNGVLSDELQVMERQIHKLLQVRGISPHAFSQRIKILPLTNKPVANQVFIQVGEAILQRHKLHIHYQDYQQKNTRRSISPQTLIYYRENWFLDAWCHKRNGLRTFSLARITSLRKQSEPAQEVEEQQLNTHFSATYGLFAGTPKFTAQLRFLAPIAHEVAAQQWHPEQSQTWDQQDLLLSLPYSDHRELVRDILWHMPHVIVEGPEELQQEVRERLQQGLAAYE